MALTSFGDFVLYHLGSAKKFVLLYALSCLTTSLFSMGYKAAHRERGRKGTRSLGASGAVMGVMTLFAFISPNATLTLFGLITAPAYVFVGGMVVYSVWQSVMPPTHAGIIDVAGHVGGAFGGILFWVFGRRPPPTQFLDLIRRSSSLSTRKQPRRSRVLRERKARYNVSITFFQNLGSLPGFAPRRDPIVGSPSSLIHCQKSHFPHIRVTEVSCNV